MKITSCPASLLIGLMLSSSPSQSFVDAYLWGINGTESQGAMTQILQEDLVGMFIITEGAAYPEGDRILQKDKLKHPKRTSNIQLPDGTFYKVKNAKANWDERLLSGCNMIWVPRGSAKLQGGTIDMMGMEPYAVSADFDQNLKEEY